MAHLRRSKRSLLMFAPALAGALSVTALAGCSFVEKQTADLYSITYRITLDGKQINKLTALSYGEALSRGEDTSTLDKGDAATTNDPKNTRRATWENTAIVTATKKAWVTATPPAGTTATCTILIDGKKEIASNTGKPGEQVHCEATTPAFPEKK